MIVGRTYISTGFRRTRGDVLWHVLGALHRRWRLAFVRPPGKPGYRRIYVGPVEIEWSHQRAWSQS